MSRVAALVLATLLLAACGSSERATVARAKQAPRCASLAQWQRLAQREGIDVYCPSWLPNPLSPSFAGSSYAGTFFGARRAYLVSFIESDVVGSNNNEVHVNLRGYPHTTAIPRCDDTSQSGVVFVPCFSDPHETRTVGGTRITVYTANQGADKWHVAYLWRHNGSLYVASEHVITPYTYSQVVRNLDRVMRGLVLVHT